jgi:hypothetical protein
MSQQQQPQQQPQPQPQPQPPQSLDLRNNIVHRRSFAGANPTKSLKNLRLVDSNTIISPQDKINGLSTPNPPIWIHSNRTDFPRFPRGYSVESQHSNEPKYTYPPGPFPHDLHTIDTKTEYGPLQNPPKKPPRRLVCYTIREDILLSHLPNELKFIWDNQPLYHGTIYPYPSIQLDGLKPSGNGELKLLESLPWTPCCSLLMAAAEPPLDYKNNDSDMNFVLRAFNELFYETSCVNEAENVIQLSNWLYKQEPNASLLALINKMKSAAIFDMFVELLYSYFYTCDNVGDGEVMSDLINKIRDAPGENV